MNHLSVSHLELTLGDPYFFFIWRRAINLSADANRVEDCAWFMSTFRCYITMKKLQLTLFYFANLEKFADDISFFLHLQFSSTFEDDRSGRKARKL